MIEVFPITGLYQFHEIAAKLQPLAIPLLIFFFLIVMGIYALNAFEGLNLESKLIHLIICVVLIGIWPVLLFGLKDFVDIFNTMLIRDIFGMSWNQGLGQPLSNQFWESLNIGKDF